MWGYRTSKRVKTLLFGVIWNRAPRDILALAEFTRSTSEGNAV